MSWYRQSEFSIRFEWGLEGARHLASDADVTIVVDVLSFSTCVDVAVSLGRSVYPYFYKDDRAKEYARSLDAELANPKRSKDQLCLSPATMKFATGKSLVLPSPNGSSISFAIESSTILCGCLRNAEATAKQAMKLGSKILVIAAGEKWESDSLRPAIEDQIGAGAILSFLNGSKSPEAKGAIQIFNSTKEHIEEVLRQCSSGQELISKGFPEDVDLASQLNISKTISILKNKAFVAL